MANTKRNKVLIKGSIPTIHAVVSEVSVELTDRKKRQVSSDFQSSFDKVKQYEMEAKKRKVEEARASSSNSLDFHDVVDDRVEKNPTLQKQVRRLKTAVKEQKKEIRELRSDFSFMKTTTFESPLMVCTKQKVTETETEEENVIEEERGPEDLGSTDSTGEDETEEDPSDEDLEKDIRVDSDTPGYDEPKFIMFYSMLLQLFTMFCFNCKGNSPKARMRQCGTLVKVTQTCSQCHQEYSWKSQPTVLGKFLAGNILSNSGVLVAGASISKVLLVFRHMELCGYSGCTFFQHQRSFLLPAVLLYWERYQANLIESIKKIKNVAWSGDGRFDSLGHSAKYGVYTMFCTTILKLGLLIGIFVSDRHRGIAKWIRENCVNTKHYFDIWHVARSLGKKLLALSREKGCEIIKEWMKGIRKHLYWCVTSTKAGFESHILATGNSLLRHVSNKHNNHPDPLYKQCSFDKLKLPLTKKMLLNDIKKLSPDAQTSCLKGFHATLNYWHPKMTCFTWLGTLSR
ncbi:unnamed protein product [Pocillopora meandrina]|uniref:Transposase n=1 Tax=Pocillopora meandrina TaxID=46732 RepID=A0AAU9Y775_9CNID|nr:unnamed protein product [Pocillopora meandrina]